jgi:hypothetical protein
VAKASRLSGYAADRRVDFTQGNLQKGRPEKFLFARIMPLLDAAFRLQNCWD